MGCGSSVQIALGLPPSDPAFNSECHRPVDDADCVKIKLTNTQKKLVRATWRKIETDRVQLGGKVFFRIFDLNPEIKKLFPFREVWGDQLLSHRLFKAHAERFIVVINDVVNNLHMVETTVAPLLYNLGRVHASRYESIGFKPEYFSLYKRSMLSVFHAELGDDFTKDVAQAWAEVLEYIISQLREGFEKSKKLKNIDTSNG